MKVASRLSLHLWLSGAMLPGIACSKDKSEDVKCDLMIADINSAVSEHFSGLSIFECKDPSDCSAAAYQTSCYIGCNTNVLATRKDELAAFLGGNEIGAICDRYQTKGCGTIIDDCAG